MNLNDSTTDQLDDSEQISDQADLVSQLAQLKQDLALAQKQADEHLAGWQRARADYANLKKETEKRQGEMIQFANASLLAQLLPVYDNLKVAWQHLPEERKGDEWVKGLEQIKNQFKDFFAKLGITEIKTLGEPFNPEFHEAVAMEEKPGVSQQIIEELKPGYLLHNQVLVPAKVKIIK
ncbi:MAG: nucleotide exchange factor GrpE [Candidatus Buchananbacteria bacterium]